jgi:hypothetical protein
MQKFLMAPAAALLAACCLVPDATEPAALAEPAAAEAPVKPAIGWGNTGREAPWFYHHVWGDCAFLEHGHGRNNAWGLWRLPLGAVSQGGAAPAEHEGYAVTFTCIDGSACIEEGYLHQTPDRASSHTIPFETLEGAERYLSSVASLDKACRALK